MIRLLSFFISLVLLVSCASKAQKQPIAPDKNPAEKFELKYKTIDEFVKWISTGESGNTNAEKVKKNKAAAMKAVDGAQVKIDKKDFDCYIYDKEENWNYFSEYVKTIASGSEITNYYNVRCITSGK